MFIQIKYKLNSHRFINNQRQYSYINIEYINYKQFLTDFLYSNEVLEQIMASELQTISQWDTYGLTFIEDYPLYRKKQVIDYILKNFKCSFKKDTNLQNDVDFYILTSESDIIDTLNFTMSKIHIPKSLYSLETLINKISIDPLSHEQRIPSKKRDYLFETFPELLTSKKDWSKLDHMNLFNPSWTRLIKGFENSNKTNRRNERETQSPDTTSQIEQEKYYHKLYKYMQNDNLYFYDNFNKLIHMYIYNNNLFVNNRIQPVNYIYKKYKDNLLQYNTIYTENCNIIKQIKELNIKYNLKLNISNFSHYVVINKKNIQCNYHLEIDMIRKNNNLYKELDFIKQHKNTLAINNPIIIISEPLNETSLNKSQFRPKCSLDQKVLFRKFTKEQKIYYHSLVDTNTDHLTNFKGYSSINLIKTQNKLYFNI